MGIVRRGEGCQQRNPSSKGKGRQIPSFCPSRALPPGSLNQHNKYTAISADLPSPLLLCCAQKLPPIASHFPPTLGLDFGFPSSAEPKIPIPRDGGGNSSSPAVQSPICFLCQLVQFLIIYQPRMEFATIEKLF
jgi:hypothetical protein